MTDSRGTRRLRRSRDNRVIAGVCGGLAEYFSISSGMVRLLFVLFGLFGAGELVYIILWILMPKE